MILIAVELLYMVLCFVAQGKGSMLTWWLHGKDDTRECASLEHTRSNSHKLAVKAPPQRSFSEIVRESPRTIGGTKKQPGEHSLNGSLMGQTMLPGAVMIDELN